MITQLRLFKATITLTILVSGAVLAAEDTAYECRQGELVREVEVQYVTPGQAVPCRVEYRKAQEGAGPQILWRAENEEGYCEFKAKEFVAKLESWGWSCKPSAPSEPEPSEPEPLAPSEPAEPPAEEIEEQVGDEP